ncbi:hypothetical protein Unana1_08433 [Umbelopsis nana]
MEPVDHPLYSRRSSRRQREEIDKLLERMHIRLALAAFKAQYGYETCALDTLESKLIRHQRLSPYSGAHRHAKKRGLSESSSSSSDTKAMCTSSRRPIRKEYNVPSYHWSPGTSPQRYYRPEHTTIPSKPSSASKAYLTPISPLFNRYPPPSIAADESAKRSTTPNNGSLTPRSLSPPIKSRLHRPTRQQSPTPQKPTGAMNGSLWDQCDLAYEPSVDETTAANLLMGLWYAR